MLFCKKCSIDYEEGREFCPRCGGSLVTKEKPVSGDKGKNETKQAKPEGTLICPKCKILYERMNACIKCGGPLVRHVPSQGKEEPKSPDVPEDKKWELRAPPSPEIKKEPPQVHPPKRRPIEGTREEPKPIQKPEVKKEPPQIQTSEKSPSNESPEGSKKSVLHSKESKKKFLRLAVVVSGIIVLSLAGIYLSYSLFFTPKRSAPGPSDPEKVATPSASTEETPPSPGIPVVFLSREIEKIKDLLENIRQANLKKNISLFMSCYSANFKDREDRRRKTLESWANFNYVDLSYTLKMHSISTNSAQARVEWQIEIIPKKGGKYEASKTVLDVTFEKENNEWKIKEVNPVS